MFTYIRVESKYILSGVDKSDWELVLCASLQTLTYNSETNTPPSHIFEVNTFLVTSLFQIPEMCSPVTLYAELEDDQSVSVTCLVEEINGTTATVAAGECGVKENKKYSLAVRAVNQFGLSSTSKPVTICELQNPRFPRNSHSFPFCYPNNTFHSKLLVYFHICCLPLHVWCRYH